MMLVNDQSATNTGGHNSQLSFYEYPTHKPYINCVNQPLRPSFTLSRTASLPESNRDELLRSFQNLSVRIKTLENERERAETSFHDLINEISNSTLKPKEGRTSVDDQLQEAEENFRRLQEQHRRVLQVLKDNRSNSKSRSGKKKRRTSNQSRTIDTSNNEGRHFHLDINSIPFILGSSTTPSHNVKSNVQKVIGLLKTHNQRLCLSSKEFNDLLNPRRKSTLSPHTYLYLDHYSRSANRSSSALPTRHSRQSSPHRRPQSASLSDSQIYARIKKLRAEFIILSREHARLSSNENSSEDCDVLARRMEIILEELEQLQRRYIKSSREQMESDFDESPLDTLRRSKLLQLILKDQIHKDDDH